MSGDEPNGGAEASAQKWPPEDYALWVQSQIANRMFGRIVRWVGSISVLTVLAVATALYTYSERIIDRVKQGIVEEVTDEATRSIRDDLPDTVRSEVLQQLIQQAGLVEAARGKVQEELNELLRQQLADADFQAQAADVIMQSIDSRGGVTRVLRDNALARAQSEAAPDAVRAFGVQLYTLLATGDAGGGSPESLRQNLLAVASTPSPGPREQVLRALLEHYPLNSHGAAVASGTSTNTSPSTGTITGTITGTNTGTGTAPADGCTGRVDLCTVQDARMVRLMLTQLIRDAEAQRNLLPEFRAFFRKMAPQHFRMLADRTARDPDNAALIEINLAIARSGAPELQAALLREMATLATAEDQPGLQNLGLQVLAELDPHAAFATVPSSAVQRIGAAREAAERSFDARSEALVRLWTAQPPEVLRAAFLSDRATVQQEPAAEDGVALVRDAIVQLLRTDPVADPESERHDWRDILEARLTPDLVNGPDPTVYAAWIDRARLDAAAGRPVDWAADRVLESLVRWPEQPYADPLLRDAATFALRNAGPEPFLRYAETLAGLYRISADPDPIAQLVVEAVTREKQTGSFDWIETLLAQPFGEGAEATRDEGFANLVMANLSNAATGPSKDEDTAAAVLGATEFAAELYRADDPQQHRVAGLALARVLARTEQHRCEAWAALEDSQIVADLLGGRFAGVSASDEGLQSLRARAPWIGVPPGPGDVPVAVAAVAPATVEIDGLRGLGGGWRWIALDAPLSVDLVVDPQLDLVVMTADRSAPIARLPGGGRAQLPEGVVALGLRDCRQAGLDASTVTVAASAEPLRLEPATRAAPGRLDGWSDFRFDAGADGGEAWLLSELEAGSVAVIETRATPDTVGVDTQLWLYDGATGEELAYNDDATGTFYSRLEFRTETGRPILMRVAKYPEAPFVPGETFDLAVAVARTDALVQAGAEGSAAPAVEIGRPVIVAFPPDAPTAHVAIRPALDGAVVPVSSARILAIVDAAGGIAHAYLPPGGGPGQVHLLQGGRSYTIALERPGDGTLSTLHLRLFPAYRDLRAADVSEVALSLTAPAALSLPPGRSELAVRAGDAAQTVRVALAGDDAALALAAVEVRAEDPGAPPLAVALSPGPDGTLQGEWLAEGDTDYKIAFVFGEGAGPAMAALQMTPRRGYLDFGIGDRVRLARHRSMQGEVSWDDAMIPYVGCMAEIVELLGEEEMDSDSYLVRVDLPAGDAVYDWVWRVADLEPAADTEPQPAHCPG